MLYHATYGKYLKGIMKYGLNRMSQKNWDISENYIYLAVDPDVAISFAESSDTVPEEYLDDIVLLGVDEDSLDMGLLEPDSNIILDDGEDPYSFQYAGDIPASAIKVVEEN